jgi:hypothetical protein
MITLPNPITYTPPPINIQGKPPKTFQPVTVNQLSVLWLDDPDARTVRARIAGIPVPLTLWSGAAYTAIGDWTEAEATAQVLTLLATNPAQVLEGLFRQSA